MLLTEIYQPIYEGIIRFSKDDLLAAIDHSIANYPVLNLQFLKDGEVVLGYEVNSIYNGGGVILSASLYYKTKTIRVIGNGLFASNKSHPHGQQLISTLIKAGIITKDWNVDIGKGAAFYNKSVWTEIPEPLNDKAGDLASRANRLTQANTANLIFFHGTSSIDYEKIKTKGILPLFVGSNTLHGFDSRAKHKENSKLIYLATTIDVAFQYAKTRTNSVDKNRGIKSYDWGKTEDNEPVVLQVKIPDPTNLRTDDDFVNRIAREIGYELWAKKNDNEKQNLMKILSRAAGFEITDPSTAMMLWRESNRGFKEIMSKIPKSTWGKWLASITQYEQVGYSGIIPPRHIMKRVV